MRYIGNQPRVSGNRIDGGTITNFASTGFDDNATANKVTLTDSDLTLLADLILGAGKNLTVPGNITVNGTVDGVDVSQLNSDAVKISGAQNIAGIKSFSDLLEALGNLKIANNTPIATIKDLNGATNSATGIIEFRDSADALIASLDLASQKLSINAVDGVDLKYNGTTQASVVATGINLANTKELSGIFTGTLKNGTVATTQAQSDNSTNVSTTEYVRTAIANLIGTAPGVLDTLGELSDALADDQNFATSVTNSLALKAPLASPTFTGTVTIPTISVTTGGTLTDVTISGSSAQMTAGTIGSGVTISKSPQLTINGIASGTATFTNLGNATLTLAAGNAWILGAQLDNTLANAANNIINSLPTVGGLNDGDFFMIADSADGGRLKKVSRQIGVPAGFETDLGLFAVATA